MRPPEIDRRAILETEHLLADLKVRSVRGGAVTVAAQIVKMVAQFAAIVVLARLLEPSAFGLVAMTAAAVAFLELFKDLGLSAATVQRPVLTHAQVSTMFWLNVGLGFLAAALTAALAPLLAWFYGESALIDITLCLAVGFIVSGLSTQHMALLRRQMRFGALASLQVGAELVGMAAAVAAALAGMGYWALVVQRLAWVVVLTAGAWCVCAWRPGRAGPLRDVRELLHFGGNVAASNLVGLLARSADQILIGWFWGAAALGLYERASKLVLMPLNNLNAPLHAVAMPALSRAAEEPARHRRAYLGMIEKLAMVTMPVGALLVTVPDWIVSLALGPQWMAVVPVLAWLGVTAIYQPVTYTLSWLLMSQNRTGEMSVFSLFNALVLVTSIAVALPYGMEAVAAAYALSGLCLRVPALLWMVGRHGEIRAGEIIRALLPSSLAALLSLGGVYALRRFMTLDNIGPVAGLAAAAGLTMCLALACYLGLPKGRDALRDLVRLSAVMFQRKVRA
ncbi:MAG: lipopolysaccharide biosynthesis protein [Alphaproteobacteria bacterium]